MEFVIVVSFFQLKHHNLFQKMQSEKIACVLTLVHFITLLLCIGNFSVAGAATKFLCGTGTASKLCGFAKLVYIYLFLL
jgi:hypothetical protein